MTIPGIQLTADDAMEPTELLGLLIDWTGSDPGRLPASLRRFIGNDAHDTILIPRERARQRPSHLVRFRSACVRHAAAVARLRHARRPALPRVR